MLSSRSSKRARRSRNVPFSFKSLRFSSASSSRCPSTFSSLFSSLSILASSLSQRVHGIAFAVSLSCVCTGCGWLVGCTSPGCIGPRPKNSQSVDTLVKTETFSIHPVGICNLFLAEATEGGLIPSFLASSESLVTFRACIILLRRCSNTVHLPKV